MPTNFTLNEIVKICKSSDLDLGLRYQLAYLGIGHHLGKGTVIGVLNREPLPVSEDQADVAVKTRLYALSICTGFHITYNRAPTVMENLAARAGAALGFANKPGLFAGTTAELQSECTEGQSHNALAQEKYIELADRAAETIISRDSSLGVEVIDIESVKVKPEIKVNINYEALAAIRATIDAAKEAKLKSAAADDEIETKDDAKILQAREEAVKLAAEVGAVSLNTPEAKVTGGDDDSEREVIDGPDATTTDPKLKNNSI